MSTIRRLHNVQGGVALVAMLLVLAVMVAVTVAAATAHQYGARRALNLDRAESGALQIGTAEAWAIAWVDGLDPEALPLSADDSGILAVMPVLEAQGIRVEGVLIDPQGRINVNGLGRARQRGTDAPAAGEAPDGDQDPDASAPTRPGEVTAARLIRLAREAEAPPALVAALQDWIDADGDTRYPDGGEDDFYLRLTPPYRAANNELVRLDELLLVRGFTRREFQRLVPDLTALPGSTPVNVNTATRAVLMSLHDKIDRYDADALIGLRKQTPYAEVSDFLVADPLAGVALGEDELTVRSDYFMLRLRITSDGDRVGSESLIGRGVDAGSHVLHRRRTDGADFDAG